jgi:hypothetical protein
VGGTKDVNIEKIRKLAPTHVIVNIDENESRPWTCWPSSCRTSWSPIRTGAARQPGAGAADGRHLRREAAAERWCAEFEAEYAALRGAAGAARTVLYCIWQDPWMTVSRDTYIAAHAGRTRLAGAAAGTPARYPRFDWSQRTGVRAGCGAAVDRTLPLYRSACGRAGKAARHSGAWSMGK